MNDFREYNNYLMHYGIPGQRYGIRRYQNEDGTLTPEGKRRYLVNAERNSNYGDTKGTDYFQGQKGFNARDTVHVSGDNFYVFNRNEEAYGHRAGSTEVRLADNQRKLYEHDKAVRKAAEVLESIEHSWNVFKTHREELGKEANQKRENRVQHIEDKITRAEEKVKSIFKKWGF